VIAERDGVVLRLSRDEDLPAVDALTVECYAPIQASYVSMLGRELYETVRHEPELIWEDRKIAQNRRLYADHPERVWVLEDVGGVFGFVTFWLFPERSYGHLDNNGVRGDRAGEGWGAFMYRHVLEHFRSLGLRYAHVDTGLDDAHIPARRAYEAVGFDRTVPEVEYWQDLEARNPGSTPQGAARVERRAGTPACVPGTRRSSAHER
jgi:ribosomal protein S18 acetylase RimI-like enzyme